MDFSIASILTLDGVTNGAIYALLALATVLVFAVTRVIFIPQGEFVAYGALTLAIIQAGNAPGSFLQRNGDLPGTVWLLFHRRRKDAAEFGRRRRRRGARVSGGGGRRKTTSPTGGTHLSAREREESGGSADWADWAGEGERKREVLGRLSAQSQKRLLKTFFNLNYS